MSDPLHHDPELHELPESLRLQLKQFRRRVWRIKIFEAILAGFFGLLLSYILVFALDRLLPTPEILRLLILLAGVSLFAVFAPLWINRWVFKHRRESQIAHLIAKEYPKLGDRLLGVVELQNQDETNTSLSPRLRDAAMAGVASEVKDRDLENALPKSWRKNWALAVVLLISISATAWTLNPKASWNALQRWMMPLAQIERYTETKIDLSSLPQPYYVAHGEAYSLDLKLTADSNVPELAKARTNVSQWQYSAADGLNYSFEFHKILKENLVELRVGDAFVDLTVSPIMRPTLQDISLKIHYPSYLQKADELVDATSGHASIVEGSQVTVVATANRELSSASVTSSAGSNGETQQLETFVTGHTFSPAAIEISQNIHNLSLKWIDQHSLSSLSPTKLTIEKLIDQPSSPYLQNTPSESYVLADSAIEFEVLAEDDFGLKIAGIEWLGEFTKPSALQPAKGSLATINGSPSLRNATEPMIFSFQAYDIRPQKLTIRAWSEDYKESNMRSYSEPITVYVLTKEEHRQLIEKRTQSAINKLEDLMREELGMLDENKRLERKGGEQLQENENLEKLAEQTQKELQGAESMNDLAKEMEDIFQEASSNGEIDPSIMKKLAETALQMRNMAQQKMPEIAQNLKNSQSQENTQERTQEEVAKAVKQQTELLQQMEETIAKANEANKKLEEGTFVNRLRKAAGDQEELANTMIDATQDVSSLAQMIMGKEFEELDPSDQRTLFALYSLQQQTGSDIRWIQEDLGHFYSRTQVAEHKELLDEMQNSTIESDMITLLSNLEKNRSYMTIDLSKTSAELLREWASKLEGASDDDDQGGGGGGGGGGENPEDEDFEFMLKVMEMVKDQDNVRSRIRSLEQKRRLLKNEQRPTPNNLPQ